jgi:alkanesulfonate monooxygenase SsuD/methylene tetrahydromethanopterin reductase-like flavin-dependent oxidoreductase (luciferase family)
MSAAGIQVGLGLWSMRSTAYVPRPYPALYAELRRDAQLAEELGYDAIWVAEHHFWYDGWCPQPLVAAASCLAATSQLRVGTAMHLLAQHDAATTSRDVSVLLACFGDRVDLGVALGYRDEEYDAVGLARNRRGRMMDDHLDRLLADQTAAWGVSAPPVYVGGIADAAIRRAARRGLSLLLPNSLTPAEVAVKRDLAMTEATAAGRPLARLGMLVDVWVCRDEDAADRARERLVVHYREYAGAWFRLRGELGFSRPDLLDRQSARTRRSAVVGTAEQVLAQLLDLRAAGTTTFVLQLRADVPVDSYQENMKALAATVLPGLRAAA